MSGPVSLGADSAEADLGGYHLRGNSGADGFASLQYQLRAHGGDVCRTDPAAGPVHYFLQYQGRKMILPSLESVQSVMMFLGCGHEH